MVSNIFTIIVQFWYSMSTIIIQFWYSMSTIIIQFWYSMSTIIIPDYETMRYQISYNFLLTTLGNCIGCLNK